MSIDSVQFLVCLRLTVSFQREAARNISSALLYSLEAFQSLQGDLDLESNAAQGYTICLEKARELCQNNYEQGSDIRYGLGDLIWSYIDPLATSGSTDTRLVRLSVEALLTFKTFLSLQPSDSTTPSRSSNKLIPAASLIDTVVDVLLDDLTCLTRKGEKWISRGRTFNACFIRILLWIWRNHPDRDPRYAAESRQLFTSSCRLWAVLEKEVDLSQAGSFGDEDKPLTPDDLKGTVELAEWIQSQTYSETRYYYPEVMKCTFIGSNADVGINRLYAHFDRRVDWGYHFYDLDDVSISCSRSVYREDRML